MESTNQKTWRATLAALCMLGILAFAAHASATVMIEIPFERLTRESDLIVHARVLRTGSRMVNEGGVFEPHTASSLEVITTLRGQANGPVVIDEIGGTGPQTSTWIAGTPRYRANEEVVVFLRRLPSGAYRTHGMAQGHFEVRHGVPGVEAVVVRDTQTIGMASWQNGQMSIAPGSVVTMPLGAFIAYVQQLSGALGGAL
jgi:hypothetical protein